MENITDAKRLEAVSLFTDKCNIYLLSKEEVIAGIQSIMTGAVTGSVSFEAKELYADAIELIYRGRK